MTKTLKSSSGKKTAFLTNGAGSNLKLKPTWIKDLHIKPDTLKLTEEKVGKRFEPIGTGEIFLNKTPMAYALRSTIDNWDLIKLQSFYKTKDTVNRTKQQPTDWEKIFTNPKSNRGLIPIYTKNSRS